MARIGKKQQKLIDELARRENMCREFMNDWLLFNQILSAYPTPGVNKAQLENQFLKVKSKLAREHNVLKEALQSDFNIDSNTMNIVSGATNLEAIYSQSEVAVKKLQNEWHRAFISINETLGGVEDKKARSEAGEKIVLDTLGMGGPVNSGMSDQAKKNMLIAGAIVVVFAVIALVPGIRSIWVDSWEQLTR